MRMCPHPVGSVVHRHDGADPNSLWPSTVWSRVEDAFLLASGPSHALGDEGGEESHALTSSEMPSHTHMVGLGGSGNNGYLPNASTTARSFINYLSNGNSVQGILQDRSPGQWSTASFNQSTGGSQAHNNMPPYLVVDVWRRTA